MYPDTVSSIRYQLWPNFKSKEASRCGKGMGVWNEMELGLILYHLLAGDPKVLDF